MGADLCFNPFMSPEKECRLKGITDEEILIKDATGWSTSGYV